MIVKILSLLFMLYRTGKSPNARRKMLEQIPQRLTDLGVLGVKLGQALSVRSDIIGDDFAQTLSVLQDRLPPFAHQQALAILAQELGQAQELIAFIEDKPVAAASLAQVYRIQLHDGRTMALKILRPNIEKEFLAQVAWLSFFARILVRISKEARRLKLLEVCQYMAKTAKIECDLTMEAASADQLRYNLRDETAIFYVPQVEWRLTSRRVACFEWVDGVRFDDSATIAEWGLSTVELTKNAARVFFLQVFRDGFFHGDLHGGNVFVRRDGVIVPVDFGIMGHLSRKRQLFLADLLLGLLYHDYKLIARIHREQDILKEGADLDHFALAMRSVGEKYLARSWVDISVGSLLSEMFAITRQFGMETQIDLLLYQKSVVMAEGLGRLLNPEVNMWLLSKPLIEQWLIDNRGAKAQLREFLEDFKKIIKKFLQST